MVASERRQVLRDALIDAAERVIAEQGLHRLKARDLAGQVGCALGAIYNVFPDLDGLVLEVNRRTLLLFERHVAEAEAAARVGGAEGAPAAEAAVADLVRLAVAYLAFARRHGPRWRALFQHRAAGDRPTPEWYLVEQHRLFRHIERPLRDLRPGLADGERALLARSLFSATHGLVSLGLEERLMALPAPVLEAQVGLVVEAAARGLAAAG